MKPAPRIPKRAIVNKVLMLAGCHMDGAGAAAECRCRALLPEFARLLSWLMLNRGPLDVLVHPETGDDLADHRDHAMWVGEMLPLRLETLGGAD
jgi:aromatic ring-cleaving dioxygenase